MPIAPPGGTLIDRVVPATERKAERLRAGSLPRVDISSLTLSNLFLIAVGGYSPLARFRGQADHESVVERGTLENGLPRSIPITRPVSPQLAGASSVGSEVALIAPDGEVAALLDDFDRVDEAALGIVPLKVDHSFFCRRCGRMVSPKTWPYPQENHVFLSGTRVRELLISGQRPLVEFSRPEVADDLVRAYAIAEPVPA